MVEETLMDYLRKKMICFGHIKTDMIEEWFEGQVEELEKARFPYKPDAIAVEHWLKRKIPLEDE